MKIGVISEGHADRAVIVNIIIGLTGLDESDIIPLLPSEKQDETDKANNAKTFSTWSVVKSECEGRELIDEFLGQEGNEFVAIHMDTAESHEFLKLPPKGDTYCDDLRSLVEQKMNEWLAVDISDNILYAISVEEIEAWILTIYDKQDSSKFRDAKGKMDQILGRQEKNTTSSYDNFLILSKPFRKTRTVEKEKYLSYNSSLKSFYTEIRNKVLPKLG